QPTVATTTAPAHHVPSAEASSPLLASQPPARYSVWGPEKRTTFSVPGLKVASTDATSRMVIGPLANQVAATMERSWRIWSLLRLRAYCLTSNVPAIHQGESDRVSAQ